MSTSYTAELCIHGPSGTLAAVLTSAIVASDLAQAKRDAVEWAIAVTSTMVAGPAHIRLRESERVVWSRPMVEFP